MTTPGEPCRTCDGTGFVETAPPDSRAIHQEPCPDCSGPVPAAAPPVLVRALVQEYAALLTQAEPWQWMPAAEPGQRDYVLGARHALERVAERLGVTDLPAQAAQLVPDQDRQDDEDDESNEDWRAQADQVGWR